MSLSACLSRAKLCYTVHPQRAEKVSRASHAKARGNRRRRRMCNARALRNIRFTEAVDCKKKEKKKERRRERKGNRGDRDYVGRCAETGARLYYNGIISVAILCRVTWFDSERQWRVCTRAYALSGRQGKEFARGDRNEPADICAFLHRLTLFLSFFLALSSLCTFSRE